MHLYVHNREKKRKEKTKSYFFRKVNKIDKLLARLRREKTQINKIRNDKGEISMDTAEIQKNKKSIREYYQQFYANKSDKLEEMSKFLEIYSQWKLNQDIDHLNRPITRNEIEHII